MGPPISYKEQKRMRQEEIYREEVRKHLEAGNPKSKYARWSTFANSTFGVFLFATLFGVGGWLREAYTTSQAEEKAKQQKIQRLTIEVENRIRLFNKSIMSYELMPTGLLKPKDLNRYLKVRDREDYLVRDFSEEVRRMKLSQGNAYIKADYLLQKELPKDLNGMMRKHYLVFMDGDKDYSVSGNPTMYTEFQGRSVRSLIVEKRNLVEEAERENEDKRLERVELVEAMSFSPNVRTPYDFAKKANTIHLMVKEVYPKAISGGFPAVLYRETPIP